MYDLRSCRKPGAVFDPDCFSSGNTPFPIIYTWAWNAPITEEGIRDRVDAMAAGGIRAFYILPLPKEFRPTTMITEMKPEYLSPEFLRLVKYALDYGREKGLLCWLYDEGGWPSGGACGRVTADHPSVYRKTLYAEHRILPQNQPYEKPDGLISAFTGKQRIFSGETFERDTEITEIFLRTESRQFPDFYDPQTLRAFTSMTHDRYGAALGETLQSIPCMFTDEPSGRPISYSPYIAEQFREQYGYDLDDAVWALTETADDDPEADRIRSDYASLLCRLFCASMETLRDACHRYGMLSVGHLDNDHIPLGSVTNGYGDYLACLKTLDIPGVDVILGQIRSGRYGAQKQEGSCAFFPRLASSAAHQTGTMLALSESCSVYGNSLSGDEIRYILFSQLVRGISIFNLMLMPYSVEGSFGYGQRPYFHPELPGFSALCALGEEISRASYFMSVGVPAPKAALYLPWKDFWRCDAVRGRIADAYRTLGEQLEAQGIDFDIIDEETILSGEMDETRGLLLCGIAAYHTVYVPAGASVSSAAKARIDMLCHGGNPVFLPQAGILSACHITEERDLHICLFNSKAVTSTFPLRLTLGDGEHVYRFDAKDGRIYVVSDTLTLSSGEAALLLVTEKIYPCTPPPAAMEPGIVLTPVRAEIRREFSARHEGIRYEDTIRPLSLKPGICDFASLAGADFSGVIRYEFAFLPDTGGKGFTGGGYLLHAERIDYTAMVYVNGKHVGTIADAPYRLFIPAEYFLA
ncbi:MAG: hypothetical protein MJ175_04975, partial [Clostridia bacterium]|nr:hypothetical protein [Clostridia bacterium]